MKAVLKKFFIILLIANTLTSTFYQAAIAKDEAKLVVEREAEDGTVMNYLIAGTFNQPEPAFEFLLDELVGGITYVEYQPTGCDMEAIAKQIIADAEEHNYQARIFGISIGDRVARFAEAELEDVCTVAINPASSPEILKSYVRYGDYVFACCLRLLSAGVGWLSFVPFNDNGYTLALLTDQLWDVAFCDETPKVTSRTLVVFCSSDDELLSNIAIAEYFDGVQVAFVMSNHGNTVERGDDYLDAWTQWRIYHPYALSE